jgi:sulfur relay (sulfurtransferase) DsrF/TusC family protein
MGAALDLFFYVVYTTPIGSKHKNESLFQNLATNIIEVQTLGGIVLLGGDFNACTAMLLDTIDTSNLCELLQVLELVETK